MIRGAFMEQEGTRVKEQPRIASHGLALPTGADVREALDKLMAPDEATRAWTQACADVGVEPERVVLELATLRALADRLAARDDLARVTGCSLRIRLLTFESLQPSGEDP